MNTIIEKIRAEVDKLPEKYKGLYKQFGNSLGFIDGLDMVKKILSDLEKEEKPMNPQPVKELLTFDGFVDKVGSWFVNLKLRRFRKTVDGEIYPATELVQAYEWFVHELSEKYREKHLQEHPVCEGLKKRASEIYPNKEGDLCSLHSTLQRGGYIRGYQDCKEQMMNDAVEGVVSLQFADGTGAVRTTDGFVLNGLRCGQKVRIIIVKEEGK